MPNRVGSRRDLSILERTRGRASALTPEVAQRIVLEISQHGKHSLAAGCAGINKATLSCWIKRAIGYSERLEAGGEIEHLEEPYLDFANEVVRAEYEFRARALHGIVELAEPHEIVVRKVTRVTKGGIKRPDGTIEGGETTTTEVVESRRSGEWQGLAWVLERVDPDEFMKVSRTELTGADGEPIETDTRATITVRDETSERLGRILRAVGDAREEPRAVGELEPGGSEVRSGDVVDAASYEVQPPHDNGTTNGVPPPQ